MRRRTEKIRLYLSAFLILFGGLCLVRLIAVLAAGLMDGEAVLPRLLSPKHLCFHLFLALFVALLWCYPALRRK